MRYVVNRHVRTEANAKKPMTSECESIIYKMQEGLFIFDTREFKNFLEQM